MPPDVPDRRSRFVRAGQFLLACGLVVAIAVPASGVGTLDIVGPSAQGPTTTNGGSLVASEPVEPTVTELPVTGVDKAGLRALPGQVGGAAPGARRTGKVLAALTAPAPVSGYATVGVSWDHDVTLADDEIFLDVRTRDDDGWSDWEKLPYDSDHAPDPGSEEAESARPGSAPLIVGDVDQVQLRAVTADGRVPEGMQLALIDPGEDVAPVVEDPAIDTATLSSAETDDAALTGNPSNVTPKPKIFSRAQWGADERMRDKPSLHYSEVHAGFVHHTVNANGYTRDQVPSIIRGIYAYHTQSLGWSDVGYNFLVDRFGRIWEGRYGGVGRPVVGAHTLGYNDDSFAMSAIGNFETTHPSKTMLRAYGRLFAWKLSLHGVDAADDKQWVTSKYFKAINGHRDAGQTACPGRYLYEKLPRIRTLAKRNQLPWAARQKMTNISGSPHPDLVVRDASSKKAFLVHTGGLLGFKAARTASDSGWTGKDMVLAAGDLNSDGIDDMMTRAASSKKTVVRLGDGNGHFLAGEHPSLRFDKMDQLTGVGDLDKDGKDDLVGRRGKDGELLLFPGNGEMGFSNAERLAGDWSGYDLTAGVGDFDGDGNRDLVARDTTGSLWLVPGTGKGGLKTPVSLGTGWEGYDVIAGRGDLTNDGHPDLVVRNASTKVTRIFAGTGTGQIGGRVRISSAVDDVDHLAAAGQVTGKKAIDLVGRNDKGALVVFTNNGRSDLKKLERVDMDLRTADLLLNVGDWNGDGHTDVMSRSGASGSIFLRAGDGAGNFAKPVKSGNGWGSVKLVAAVGDITGDGYPDLMGQPTGGAMRIYPGNGSRGFKHSYIAHSAIGSSAQVGIGLWDGDGSPDSLFRTGKSLRVYSGNGPGGLTSSREVASGLGRYDWLIGVGDMNRDGRPDLLARARSNGNLWMLPGRADGFGARKLVGGGYARFDLAD